VTGCAGVEEHPPTDDAVTVNNDKAALSVEFRMKADTTRAGQALKRSIADFQRFWRLV